MNSPGGVFVSRHELDQTGRTVWEVAPQYRSQYPNFVVTGATPQQIANFERVMLMPPSTNGGSFIQRQSGASYASAYIRIDFGNIPKLVGASFEPETNQVEFVQGSSVNQVVRYAGLGGSNPTFEDYDARIQVNNVIWLPAGARLPLGAIEAPASAFILGNGQQLPIGAVPVYAASLPDSFFRRQMGLRDANAFEQLNIIHELLHAGIYEGPNANLFRGHSGVFQSAMNQTNQNAQVRLTSADILNDPIELRVYQDGVALRLITDEAAYLRQRVGAYESVLREQTGSESPTVGQLQAVITSGGFEAPLGIIVLDKTAMKAANLAELKNGDAIAFKRKGASGELTRAPIAALARQFGSILGRQLAGGDLVLGVATGSLLGVIGLAVDAV